jgi:hypothetical protein
MSIASNLKHETGGRAFAFAFLFFSQSQCRLIYRKRPSIRVAHNFSTRLSRELGPSLRPRVRRRHRAAVGRKPKATHPQEDETGFKQPSGPRATAGTDAAVPSLCPRFVPALLLPFERERQPSKYLRSALLHAHTSPVFVGEVSRRRLGAPLSKSRARFSPINGSAKHAEKGHIQLDPGYEKQAAVLGTTSRTHPPTDDCDQSP